jgi:hypothetical protein
MGFGKMKLTEKMSATLQSESTTFKLKEAGIQYLRITAANWKKFLKMHNLPEKPTGTDRLGCWVWENKIIYLVACNNPVTGEYGATSAATKREDEKDYASSVGISGSDLTVTAAFDWLMKQAIDYKDKNPSKRAWV